MKDGEEDIPGVWYFFCACRELYRDCSVTEHSFGGGLYCEIHDCITLSPREVERIEKRMRRIVELNEPFVKREVSMEEANSIFLSMGLKHRAEIMQYRPDDTISIYQCGDMQDYLYGYLVPSTAI